MLNSLFILNQNGEAFFEKHWRGSISRVVADKFYEKVLSAGKPTDVVPVIQHENMYLIHVFRNQLFFLAVVTHEASPGSVIELLQRMVENFERYFGQVNEQSLKNNFVCVYELLDEMVDNGFPLTTEPNILMELIKPPSLGSKVKSATIGGSNVRKFLPEATVSNIPWRRTGVKYNTNEVYFDIVEEMDVTIDSNGQMVQSECNGRIQCKCRLSGMPDLTLTFRNPNVMEQLQFHPCVRYNRWEADRVLSFVPPDGEFRLCSYRTPAACQPPVYARPQISFHGNSGRIEIMAGPKPGMFRGAENVALRIPLQQGMEVTDIRCTEGKTKVQSVDGFIVWELGKVSPQSSKTYSMNATLRFGGNVKVEGTPAVQLIFRVPGQSVSGIAVDSLICYSENYKMYKGVRNEVRSGRFFIRT